MADPIASVWAYPHYGAAWWIIGGLGAFGAVALTLYQWLRDRRRHR